MRSVFVIAAIAASLYAQISRATAEASFDCTKARSRIEKLICSDEELATLDWHLGAYYAAGRSQFSECGECLRTDQVQWLRKVRDQCEDVECLKRTYLDRLAEFHAIQPGATAITYRELPARSALLAIVPPNGDEGMIPREPARDVQIVGRYAFDADYGLTFIDEQQQLFVLAPLNQSVPEQLEAAEKDDARLLVRGKILERAPAADSYPFVPPPHGEFDPHECVFVYRAAKPGHTAIDLLSKTQ